MNESKKEKRGGICFYNIDNIEFMKSKSDNYYDLAIVDPPYGIGEDGRKGVRTSTSRPNSYNRKPKYEDKGWDKKTPDKKYFKELMRVSKNQIIFGANHFISKIPFDSSCWIVWDKKNEGTDFADCELAWASFKTAVRKVRVHKFLGTKGGKECIHPTQKPVYLYRWLLQNYAKENDKILDTHGGSGSIAIACDMEKYDLDILEIDKDYFNDSIKRFDEYNRQGVLF